MNEIALVAHGGYGRRDVAPYQRRRLDDPATEPSACRPACCRWPNGWSATCSTSGWSWGTASARSRHACRLATRDAMICTSLVDSRLLAGNPAIFESFMHRFRQQARWRAPQAPGRRSRSRATRNAARFGETVFLLEPNIKRSQGTLRDFQLLRWVGFARYGVADLGDLRDCGGPQRGRLRRHPSAPTPSCSGFATTCTFAPARPTTCSTRAEQLRIAEQSRRARRPTACCRSSISCATTSATRTA